MKKIIIAIHGLKNKPPKKILKHWWEEAVYDGLKINGYKHKKFKFDLVYWADLNYDAPEPVEEGDENTPGMFSFSPQLVEKNQAGKDKIKQQVINGIRKTIETSLDFLFLSKGIIAGIEKITDNVIRKNFADLDIYYNGNCAAKPDVNAKQAFRSRLLETLKKYKRYKIMLIAHSMGSIIAYDVLTQVDKKTTVQYFATAGSPLGLPVIIKRILEEQQKDVNMKSQPVTPESITHGWYNFSDLDDKIAFVYNLEKEFTTSSIGIKPVDVVVKNNYAFNGEAIPHKIYGYVRTPEFAKLVYNFILQKSWLAQLLEKAGNVLLRRM